MTAPKFHAVPSEFQGEISHMKPIQSQKLTLLKVPISK